MRAPSVLAGLAILSAPARADAGGAGTAEHLKSAIENESVR